MSSSKILFYLCASFIVGIFLESMLEISQIFLWVFLFSSFLFIIVFTFLRKEELIVIGFCVLFLTIGILRVQISEFNIHQDKLVQFLGQDVTFGGTIIAEPDVRESSQKIKVKTNDSIVLITTGKYPEYQYLDQVKVSGQLEAPFETPEFNYKNYLLKDHIYSVVYFPKISVQGGPASGGDSGKINLDITKKIYEKTLYLKEKLRESIKKIYLLPQSYILEGSLLGDSGAISQDFKDKLTITGLRHIIAVSGTHIVILSCILMPFLILLGFWRKHAILSSIFIVWFYIILTGLHASGVRAGIMGSALMLSQVFNRQNNSLRMLVLACSLMLLQNPLLLFYDAGFQLSFLAALGIIWLSPVLGYYLNILFKEKLKWLVPMISATLSAQIFTIPIMIFNFGNISLVSLLTNILILPIVPLIMIFGFLSVIFGAFFYPLGFVLSFPVQILLIYFIKVIDIFSKPYMALFFKNVSWLWLVVLYAFIFFFTWFFKKRLIVKY